MKTAYKFLLLFIAFTSLTFAQGKTETIYLESQYMENREVTIWTPENYSPINKNKYVVLYMHDGQNVFNNETAFNGLSWNAAETAQKVIDEGIVEPFIIVAISNTSNRFYEYFPQKSAEYLDSGDLESVEKTTGTSNHEFTADAYLKFIVNELKPFIDKNYNVKTDAIDTAIMGSSMGGLISFYAVCEYPNTFGKAACVSTHWTVTDDFGNTTIAEATRKYFESAIPDAGSHRIYFDYGSEGIDANYAPHQEQIDYLMKHKGYVNGENWLTKQYQGADHTEKSWSERFDKVLTFIFKP